MRLVPLGDKVVLQDVSFEEYNAKDFYIMDILFSDTGYAIYKVIRSGFDSIWVTEENFVKEM